jgi:hypothetical protein
MDAKWLGDEYSKVPGVPKKVRQGLWQQQQQQNVCTPATPARCPGAQEGKARVVAAAAAAAGKSHTVSTSIHCHSAVRLL